MGLFSEIKQATKTLANLTESLRVITQTQIDLENKIYSLDPTDQNYEELQELKSIKNDLKNIESKLSKFNSIVKISSYIASAVLIVVIISVSFLLQNVLKNTHLRGYGARQFKNFDWLSFSYNLMSTILITLLISEIIFISLGLIDDWVKNDKVKSFMKNFGELIFLTSLIGSFVISISLSMNSDQLAISTSVIALFAVFEFVFRNRLHNLANGFVYISQRLTKRFIKPKQKD